ncbi:hypothetical protein K1719_031982 [Acacia pycnantha]|nr:hypothetical protein K1719_031982 [Acacia pycnantha]
MEALSVKGSSPPLTEDDLRSTKKVRIRNKLLNLDRTRDVSQPLNEVVLSDDDYRINRESDIPSIEFSSHIKDVLVRGMERTVVLKLLGKSISYRELLSRTQSLWQPKGTYQLIGMEGGFHFASFDLEEDYMKALTGGP